MRKLIGLVLVIFGLWAGYWGVGSFLLKKGMTAWFEARRAEGWAAEARALRVQGFPSRFDMVFSDIALADPDTGWAWEAERFQVNALTYRPHHMIAVWPASQILATPQERFDVTSADMRASLRVKPGIAMEVEQTTLTAEALAIQPESGAEGVRAEAITLAMARAPAAAEPIYRFGLSAEGFRPAQPWKARVDPEGRLPERFDALSADYTVTFDRVWDRHSVEDARPQPQHVVIRLIEARWGQLQLALAGEFEVDAQGWPQGEVTLKAVNWREIVEIGRASGTLTDGMANAVNRGLNMIAQMNGRADTIDLPLTFRGHALFLGPVPLGPSPNFRLR